MLIEVTELDIQEGVSGICRYCPIALALKRVYGNGYADYDTLMIEHPPDTPNDVYRVDAELAEWMAEFDADGEGFVEPITINLDPVSKVASICSLK